jgi:hypothetical protein
MDTKGLGTCLQWPASSGQALFPNSTFSHELINEVSVLMIHSPLYRAMNRGLSLQHRSHLGDIAHPNNSTSHCMYIPCLFHPFGSISECVGTSTFWLLAVKNTAVNIGVHRYPSKFCKFEVYLLYLGPTTAGLVRLSSSLFLAYLCPVLSGFWKEEENEQKKESMRFLGSLREVERPQAEILGWALRHIWGFEQLTETITEMCLFEQ